MPQSSHPIQSSPSGKCRLLVAGLVAVALSILVHPARAETLDEAWGIARQVDERLRASELETESARWDHSAAKAMGMPKLNNATAYNWLSATPTFKTAIPGLGTLAMPVLEDQFVTSSTMVTMPLYTGGKIRYTVGAAASQVAAAEKEQVRTWLDIKLEVANSYVTVLRARRAVTVAEANVTSLQTHVQVVTSLLKQGLVAQNDLLAVQVALADARQKALRAGNGTNIAGAAYNRLLQRPFDVPVELEEVQVYPSSESLDELTARALVTRPELARLSAQVNALRCQAESLRAANRPQLGVLGGYTYLENEHLAPEGYGSLSFAVDWMPYDGGIARARGNAVRQKANAVSRLRAEAVTLIRLDVRKAWLDEQEARSRIDVTGKAIKQSEENLRVARSRYRQGEGTNTEVLDAETLRTLTYNNYHNALYEAILSTLKLRRAVGTL